MLWPFICCKMSIFCQILSLLSAPEVSNQVIFEIITILDEDTINNEHDYIYDLLFEFLKSRDNFLLETIREFCSIKLNNLTQ